MTTFTVITVNLIYNKSRIYLSNLSTIIRSSWYHLFTFRTFFIGPGFNSTFPLTINNNAIIKAITSRLHITFKSLHVHFSQFTLSLGISRKFSSFTHLQPTIRGQKQPMEDLHCSTEITVKREIRNSQTKSTCKTHVNNRSTHTWAP